jgi:hypothetical protein
MKGRWKSLESRTNVLLYEEQFGLPIYIKYVMFFSCSRADERRCGLGGKTRAESWEYVCLKRRKEDFREAMRRFDAVFIVPPDENATGSSSKAT